MRSALILTSSEKGASLFTGMLNEAGIKDTQIIKTVSAARRAVLERDYNLIIVNAPLPDETGEVFARETAHKGQSEVILLVKAEYFDAVSAACEKDGVLVVSKPVVRQVLWAAIKLAAAAHARFNRIDAENVRLKQKIEDINIVARAKCLMISYMSMSEQEAHRYIEKQAMDMRTTKREIAEGILMTYDS